MVTVPTEVWTNTPDAWSLRATMENPWEAAGWSVRGQTIRFQAVLRHLDLDENDMLLDFGCGTGEFCRWVEDATVPVHYFGWDWAAGMRSRARHDHPYGTILYEWHPEFEFDHVVAIGPFNLRDHWNKVKTFDMLRELWAMTRKSLVACLYRGDDPQCIRYEASELALFAELAHIGNFVIDGTYLDNDLILRMNR